MTENQRFKYFGGGFVIWGTFVLLTSVGFSGGDGYGYSDSNGNLDSTTTVKIIDFVLPLIFGSLFAIGGFFILKEQMIGVYLIWTGCILGPINEGVSRILLGASFDSFDMVFILIFNLFLAYIAVVPFNKSKNHLIN